MKTTGTIDDYVTYLGEDLERRKIMGKGKAEGKERARDEYPYAVERNTASLQRIAEQIAQEWYDKVASYNKDYKGNWHTVNPHDRERITQWVNKAQEIIRVFTTAWVAGYEEEVATRDEAAKPKVKPQPTPETNPTEAIVTVTREQHTADTHSYWLRLADPRYFDEAYDAPEPLTFDFSEIPASGSTTASMASSYDASSAMTGRAIANSILGAYDKTSNSPQKKKPRIYWGKR